MKRATRAVLIASEDGQDLIEYALLTTAIALAVVASVQMLGSSVGQLWSRIGSQLAAIFL